MLTGGAEQPRDLPVPGRELDGVHFAMEFLPQQNKVVAGDDVAGPDHGDRQARRRSSAAATPAPTASARRTAMARASITQFELLPQPPEQENKPLTWPYWPIKLRTSSSHEEGCARDWAVATKRFEGRDGKVEKLVAARVEWQKDANGAMKMVEVPGQRVRDQGRPRAARDGLHRPRRRPDCSSSSASSATRAATSRPNTDDYRTSVPKVFAAGDMRRGQSLVVWAIREGRQCARAVDEFLMGSSELPR